MDLNFTPKGWGEYLAGDLDTLITRTEELKATLSAALIGKIEQSASQLRVDLARDAGAIAQTIQEAAGDAQAAAAVVVGVSRFWRLLRASAVVFWVAWLPRQTFLDEFKVEFDAGTNVDNSVCNQ